MEEVKNNQQLNREEFDRYFSRITRLGKDKLLAFLEENGYFTAPSSASYHGACEGGNLEHSLNVTKTILDMKGSMEGTMEIKSESCIIVGLFHDLGKAGYFNYQYYSKKGLLKSGKAPAEPYEKNKEALPVPHEIASLHILSKFIDLTPEEVNAIVFHNGKYVGLGRDLEGKEEPLQMLLHFADMWSSRVLEAEPKKYSEIKF